MRPHQMTEISNLIKRENGTGPRGWDVKHARYKCIDGVCVVVQSVVLRLVELEEKSRQTD